MSALESRATPPEPTPRRAGGFAHPRHRRFLVAGALALCLGVIGTTPMDALASRVITHGSRARPWVALTFDDGWSFDRCARITKTLRAKSATATFFINGASIGGAPKRWRTILRGFPVANHTMGHAWLTRISDAEVRRQIGVDERVVERVLGRPLLHLLRPPYGAYDSRVVAIADSLGYRTVLWDTSSADTSPAATTWTVIRNATRGGSGAIVLMHCGPAATPGAVGPIIDHYRRRGFRLVDLGEMLLRQSSPTACRVRNRDRGGVHSSLQAAVRAARPGDHLIVRGRCLGSTTVGKSLHIRGTRTEDSGPPILSGRERGRVLTIRADVRVTLRDLAMIRGRSERGGGIANRGWLSLLDVDVRGNGATETGGGIVNFGTLTLGGTTSVRMNQSAVGGGITNRGLLRIEGAASVEGNVARRDGGGVFNGGHLSMSGASSIVLNQAGTAGGGVSDLGTREGVVCGEEEGANVHDNTPDDCASPASTARRATRSRR